MTARPGPGTPGAVVTATDHRRALAAFMAPGSATDPLLTRSGIVPAPGNPLRVSQNSPLGMSALVQPGNTEVYRAGRGPYTPYNDALATVTFGAAPGTNSRYDLVYLAQSDSEADGGVSTSTLGVLPGAAAASPVKPYADLPAGGIVLAEVGPIIVGTTQITDAMITNVAPYTAVRGAPILVRNQAERDALTAIASASYPITVERLDTGALERNAGSGWVVVTPTPTPPRPRRRGYARLAARVVVAGDPAWTTLAAVTATTTGLSCLVEAKVVLANANSGAARTGSVRVVLDGAPLSPVISGYPLDLLTGGEPQAPIFFEVSSTPLAGQHTWELQANGSSGAAVRAHQGTIAVTEDP